MDIVKNGVTNNVKDYMNFLQKYNILGFAIGLMIAGAVVELNNVFIDSIIMPTLDPFIIKQKYSIKFKSININLEKFIRSVLKLFILTFIIFIFFKFGMNINIATTLKTN